MIMNLLNPYRLGNELAMPAYKSTGTGVEFSTTSGNVSPPSDVAENDIMIMIGESPPSQAIVAPSGWTNMNVPTGNGASQLNVFWKRAGPSEGAVTVANPDFPNGIRLVIVCIAGCVTSGSPWHVSQSNTDIGGGGTTSCNITGYTTTIDSTLGFFCATGNSATAGAAFSAWANSDLLSVYERVDYASSSIIRHIGAATGGKNDAGTVGQMNYTFFNTNSFGGQFSGALIGTQFDSDAQAFITAAGLSTRAHKNAVNTAVLRLKGNGIWSKLKYLYPFVGGSASSHKFNLKNPQDTDAAFRLVFGSGVTHSANGASSTQSSASTGVDNIETKFVPSTEFANKATAFGVINHTAPSVNNATAGNFHGCNSGGSTNWPRFTRGANVNELIVGMGGNSRTISGTTLTLFLAVTNETTGNTAQVYIDGVATGATVSTSTGTLPTVQHFLLRYNSNGGTQGTSNHTIKFAFASTLLTAAEMAQLNSIAYQLQTDLSR